MVHRKSFFAGAAATLMVAAACAVALPVQARTFKWASSSDIPSWDVHSQNNALANGIHAAVYESLFYYDRKFQVEPVLATGYQQVSPTQVRITLRKGVKFHDGSDFNADDVVFSLNRAMDKASNFGVYTQGIDKVVKVDDYTVDIFTHGPNPVLLRQLTELRIMDKEWAEKHRSVTPKDMKSKEENHAHRHANGTGPFMLKSWDQDVRMVLVRNPNWWGKMEGNVTEIVYTPIKSEATRTAALLSGEVDMVLDPSPADIPRLRTNPALKVVDGVENRTIFLGMDQYRDELPGSNIKGRNPLKDVRVRRALYQAIDINAIHKNIMRGMSQPTGTLIAPQVNGWTRRADQRYPYDPAAARKLLAEAGYPDGFEVDFACPNNRYINDEAICQAITAMWARIGVKAKLRTLPLVTYFPMIQRYEASIYMLGWGVPTFDALYSLQSLVRSVGAQGDGNYNVGRYSNPQMDALVERIKKEVDQKVRNELIEQALLLSHQDVSHLPLHNQVIPWAMKKNIEMYHRADNRIDMRAVKVN
ncbi:ABC transporter substrate-binding protein [Schlegelella thermodepolymerans]|jgi:ABC-type dipeptide transport system, periplasmic component|uniref:ABC transporter substrate-binding protein n=1 Tax=Caldimonas thermodepolymerans TaxID=215580 RepID=A0A2S5T676_9BURK|nr:ABC transporter substrate-binding protein [Caldimonas thermodepolymerans]RDH96559.1 peptide/nickel transport system substrate-binding protein [Caldimonas thermodepolymerans]TCP04842.1 peptide/nickel transport system substrate-binding protein [Caldimonas thermodepolymerans]